MNLTVSHSRWCSQCREHRPKDGGAWVNLSLFRQRWVCVSCAAKLLKAKAA